MNKLEILEQNIGKKGKVLESSIAGLTGKIGVIESVSGNDREGYRYKIILDEPLFSFTKKLDYYPPTFLVEIV